MSTPYIFTDVKVQMKSLGPYKTERKIKVAAINPVLPEIAATRYADGAINVTYYGVYNPTSFVTIDGWRLFILAPGYQHFTRINRYGSFVNGGEFDERWIEISTRIALIPDKDYCRLLKKLPQYYDTRGK